MTEQEFKDHYIVIFVATYTAMNHDRLCQEDRHDLIIKHGCVEEAIFLSDKAWEAYKRERG